MSTGVGMSSCCLSGKVKEGKPKGHVSQIGGLEAYISEPETGSTEKTVIFLTDIFGYEFPNVRLLADNYAKAGFCCYVPDLHQGDSLPISFLDDVEPSLREREQLSLTASAAKTAKVGATLGPWLIRHREAVTKPLMEQFIRAVRLIPGTDKVGVIGFCWGGRYAILATHRGAEPGLAVDAAVACHPSLLARPTDLEPVAKPLSLALGEKDSLVGEAEQKQLVGLMEMKQGQGQGVPTEVKIYEDQVHGFALRGDWSSDKDRQAMDDAEQQGIQWFKKYLG
ncbi:esterase/lipase [Lineolata rhizophorae]|uniref:Esterase/lipase n=1 Tax=Lineolata rhizophorae TaxID=578093 RepID=A0A6A6NSV4_9PEZI|nr:esterase/lipase [Lineolata rhizophorae]